MRNLSQLGCCAFAATALFLTGCQQMIKRQAPATPSVQADNQFQLQGKIGVRTPQQTGSAFFTWVQQQEEFDIELSGILGVGKTQISGTPGQVTLNSAKTGVIQAASAEELLQRATGWQAPISYLVDWVQARPATNSAKLQKDDTQRINQIIEQGWTVDLNYNAQAKMPNRLILKQSLGNGAENRITMIIENR
ncbi:lipoprotein insertase outer membrane protein LolB [Acinetobacter lwoffii]|uniref:lipoprotein insertase outer membrane protein LolB n=1 Tax=Acinetobacter lwoffii TaxID=28090 RepID=UPI003F913683